MEPRVAVQSESGHHWFQPSELAIASTSTSAVYLGFQPVDWFDEGSEGWPFELCFLRSPDGQRRSAIEAAITTLLSGHNLRRGLGPTCWSGPWYVLHVGRAPSVERGDEGPTDLDLFDELIGLLRRLHHEHPFRQAVHLGVREASLASGESDVVLDGPPMTHMVFEADRVFARRRVGIVPAYVCAPTGERAETGNTQ